MGSRTGWDLTTLINLPFVISWSALQRISSLCRVERFIHLLFSLYIGVFHSFSPAASPPVFTLGGVKLPLPRENNPGPGVVRPDQKDLNSKKKIHQSKPFVVTSYPVCMALHQFCTPPPPSPHSSGPLSAPSEIVHVTPAAGAALWRPAGGLEPPRLTDRGAGVGAGATAGRHAVRSAGQVGREGGSRLWVVLGMGSRGRGGI